MPKDNVKKESALIKGGITGCTVIAEMLLGGLFLENLKMQKQLLAQPYPQVARTMLSAGLGGFWAGFWPWGAALGLSKGIVLGSAKAFWQNVFLNYTNVSHKNIDFYSGTLAGACQGVLYFLFIFKMRYIYFHGDCKPLMFLYFRYRDGTHFIGENESQ